MLCEYEYVSSSLGAPRELLTSPLYWHHLNTILPYRLVCKLPKHSLLPACAGLRNSWQIVHKMCWAPCSSNCKHMTMPPPITAIPSSNLQMTQLWWGFSLGVMSLPTGTKWSKLTAWCTDNNLILNTQDRGPHRGFQEKKTGHSTTIHQWGSCGEGARLPFPGSPHHGELGLGCEHGRAGKEGPAETLFPENPQEK